MYRSKETNMIAVNVAGLRAMYPQHSIPDAPSAEDLVAIGAIEIEDLPEISIPAPVLSVPMHQARKALILSGVDLLDIEPVFSALPQPDQALARVDWEFSPVVHRDSPLVASVQASKGWTDTQVDALFSLAATL